MYASLKPVLDRQLNPSEEDEASTLVDAAWSKIQNENYVAPSLRAEEDVVFEEEIYRRPMASQFWTTVQLFISSTSRDMTAEREFVTKRVMPDLTSWAEKRGIRLVKCDLRWEVPKNVASVDTIEICLGELENVKANSKYQPLFLCLIGDRYGWIPELTEVPENIARRYRWIDSLSITHMEIMQGAVRCKNRNALICFRSVGFVTSLPPERAEDFTEKGFLEKKHLFKLKKKVGNYLRDPRDQMYNYDAIYRRPTDGPFVTGNDIEFKPEFREKLLKFFRASIERLFPDRFLGVFKPPDEIEQENFNQWSYFDRHCNSTFPTNEWTNELTLYLTTSFTNENGGMSMKHFDFTQILGEMQDQEANLPDQAEVWPTINEDSEVSGWTQHPICLISDDGQGKTSLLCNVADTIMTTGKSEKVFFHFCGVSVSQNSTSYALFLKRLIQFLLRVLGMDDRPLHEFFENDVLYQTRVVHGLFQHLHNRDNKRVIIFLDGAENFQEVGAELNIRWNNFLPMHFPANCLVAMSVTPNENSWVHKYLSIADATMLKMPEASMDLRSMIVNKCFHGHQRKLDPEQITTLISREGAQIPLWLELACEEVKFLKTWRLFKMKIQDFSKTLDGLLMQVISRIVSENQDVPVGKFLSLLAISPHPLPEEELPLLLGTPENNEKIHPLYLAKLRHLLKLFARFTTDDRAVALPLHLALAKVAPQICNLMEENIVNVKRTLAFYMINFASPANKFAWSYHIVTLLWECDCRKELLQYLRYDQAGRIINQIYKAEILMRFRCENPLPAKQSMAVAFRSCFNCSVMLDFELTGKHVDYCWICKTSLKQSSKITQAAACPNHREYPLRVGEFTCRLCNVYQGPTYSEWVPLNLCEACARHNSCSHMSVEQSIARFGLFAAED